MMPTLNSKEVSLYFHLPFCTQKCAYCHFYVLPDKDSLKEQLMEGLKREWQQQLPLLQGKQIATIYFGGGTPALFGPDRIATLLGWIFQSCAVTSTPPEITLEANPENMTPELMDAYAQAGINRVSIGIQTLDPDVLNKLRRIHGPKKAIESVFITAQAGISNISIDLMYDLPGQTLAGWQETLQRASDLPITHLSLYNLTIEPHTLFFKQREAIAKQMPDPLLSLQLYESAVEILQKKGLYQYEISAFAREGFLSRHNTGYWIGRPFLGFGPSAFSYWEGRRFRNIAHLGRYSKQLEAGELPIDFEEKLSQEARGNELLAIHLRLLNGVDLKEFQLQHGELAASTLSTLSSLRQEGLLTVNNDNISLTQRGILCYDTVASEIV
jgi:oxygen-independent coproporphyrinogen-3 oxidase